MNLSKVYNMEKIIDLFKRFWFPLFILLCLIALSIGFARGQDVEIRDAKRLVEVDQNQKAIELLNKAATTYPTSAALWYYVGYAQLKNGERNLALQSFEKGIAINNQGSYLLCWERAS